MGAAWRELTESVDVDGEAVIDGEIKSESDVEPGGRSWSAIDREGSLGSGVKARGERAVGVTEIPGITEGDAGDEGGGACLEGLLVGEADLEGDGVVGGSVVGE